MKTSRPRVTAAVRACGLSALLAHLFSGATALNAQTQTVVDNSAATLTGSWTSSTSATGLFYGADYLHDGDTGKGAKTVRYTPTLSVGTYAVYAWWNSATSRATNIPYDIVHAGGTTTVTVNQTINGTQWFYLGTYNFNATGGSVLIRTTGTSGYVIADAVSFVSRKVSPMALSQNAHVSSYSSWMPTLASAGVKSIRYLPEWNDLQTSSTTWNATAEDAFVTNVSTTNGIKIEGAFGYFPTWLGIGHHGFPKNHLTQWGQFVTWVSGRYDGNPMPAIDYWEVWNEPNVSAFNQNNDSAKEYAKLVHGAWNAVRATGGNPNAKIGITVANFDAQYLKQVLQSLQDLGTPNNFDFIAVHPYELVDRLNAPDGEVQFLRIVPTIREMLNAVNLAKATTPIRFTELGARIGFAAQGETITEEVASNLLIKAYALGLAQGVQQICWFEGRDPDKGEVGFGLLNYAQAKRKAWYAYKAMTDALGPFPLYKGWLALGTPARGYGFVFGKDGANALIAWMPKGQAATINFGSTVQVVDIYTGIATPETSVNLTGKPVIIKGIPATTVTQASQNKGLPFPWGTAPVNTNLASATFGPGAVSNGLVLDRTNTVGSHTFSDGTGGLLMGANGNTEAFFALNPPFIGYGPSTYHVRITARRITLNTESGMNLFYQRMDASRNSPPAGQYVNLGQWKELNNNNTTWHPYTWSVSSAMLSHTFGYGFFIRKDNSAPFVIRKVEVSKVPF